MINKKPILFFVSGGIVSLTFVLLFFTFASITPVISDWKNAISQIHSLRVVDRNGIPLALSYNANLNTHDLVSLYDVPPLLISAFIFSEDRRFYEHKGIDWTARFGALWQNISHLRIVRGASTITEQMVRLLHPRPRSLWSRWLEGFEAQSLERDLNKADILEFYLNQIPYGSNRRGIMQAARFYFDRDLTTLSPRETLALAILVRAPTAYDLYKHPGRIDEPLKRLAEGMYAADLISKSSLESILNEKLVLKPPSLPTEARHFARYVRLHSQQLHENPLYKTTLNSTLQLQAQAILDQRLDTLRSKNVHNAGLLVADYRTGEIIAWVVGGAKRGSDTIAGEIDTITSPRQPGSAMKPFVYASALDKGWSAATLLDDSPLTDAVGHGLHSFRNYSNSHYGLITLREALGNSLNIPALLAVRYVGTGPYLTTLQHLGFESLTQSSDVYDEGLALGNGAVSLLELVQAYGALANGGKYKPLRFIMHDEQDSRPKQIFSMESAYLIGNILSDPWARNLEFGLGSVLNFPQQTAIKTGTSTDYRDAWTVGYNDRYLVGAWMGNLDHSPTMGVTGSSGPALVVRSVFSVLNKNRETQPLDFSRSLILREVCLRPADSDGNCPMYSEWFRSDNIPQSAITPNANTTVEPELVRPTDGLQIAYDPRIPSSHQKFRFEIKGLNSPSKVHWILDDQVPIVTQNTSYMLWPVQKGNHILSVSIADQKGSFVDLPEVHFVVK